VQLALALTTLTIWPAARGWRQSLQRFEQQELARAMSAITADAQREIGASQL